LLGQAPLLLVYLELGFLLRLLVALPFEMCFGYLFCSLFLHLKWLGQLRAYAIFACSAYPGDLLLLE